jgi:hypothetical protein
MRHQLLEQQAATIEIEDPQSRFTGWPRIIDDGETIDSACRPLSTGAFRRAGGQREHGPVCGRRRVCEQLRERLGSCDAGAEGQQNGRGAQESSLHAGLIVDRRRRLCTRPDPDPRARFLRCSTCREAGPMREVSSQ